MVFRVQDDLTKSAQIVLNRCRLCVVDLLELRLIKLEVVWLELTILMLTFLTTNEELFGAFWNMGVMH